MYMTSRISIRLRTQENEQYASATEYDKTLQTAFRSAEWHEAQFKIASKLYSTEATRNKHLYVTHCAHIPHVIHVDSDAYLVRAA